MNWSLIISALPALLSTLGTLFQGVPAAGGTATPTLDPKSVAALLQTEEAFIRVVQQALNSAQTLGLISFGAPLVVDGIAGPKTTAAADVLLSKFNLKV